MENLMEEFVSGNYRVRVLLIDDEWWFVARDVALSLGYKSPKDAVRQNVDEEDVMALSKKQIEKMASESKVEFFTTLELESPRGLKFINESGLYSLILRSHQPEAKKFKRWVTSEVLPSIRQKGYYSLDEDAQLTEFLKNTPEPLLKATLNNLEKEIDDSTQIQPLFKLLDYCGGNVKLREKLIILIAETITGKTI